MGFSVRLAPGVRVRASSRGVRTSIGPRVARVHVGAGHTGMSTGLGPVGYYTSVGGTRRRAPSRSGTTAATRQLAAANRVAAAQQKAEEGERLANALTAVLNLHRAEFTPGQRPVAPPPPPIDVDAIRRPHVRAAKAATGFFARADRKAAREEAERRTAADVAALQQRFVEQQAAWQTALDAHWDALRSNEPETVLATLAEAFEDNEAAAAAVGVEGPEVSLVVLVPPVSVLPERRPTLTDAGNLSLKKFTKREIADIYKMLVCGHVLVTVKEAFAVAPGIAAAKVVAARPAPADSYGAIKPEILLATRLERRALQGIRWADADAPQIVNDAGTDTVLNQKGATRELSPVDVSKEPDLQAIVEAVDFEDLLGG